MIELILCLFLSGEVVPFKTHASGIVDFKENKVYYLVILEVNGRKYQPRILDYNQFNELRNTRLGIRVRDKLIINSIEYN